MTQAVLLVLLVFLMSVPTPQKFARKHVKAWVEASLVVRKYQSLAHKTSTFSGAQVSSD